MALALATELRRSKAERRRTREPLVSSLDDKKSEFKRWLAIVAIKSGMYRLTKTGVGKLVNDSFELFRTNRSRSLAAAAVADSIVKSGDERKILGLVEQGIIVPRPDWSKKSFRIAAIKRLVSIVPAAQLIKDDFTEFGLGAMLRRYKSSPTAALVEAGYVYSEHELRLHSKTGEFKTDKIYPWERVNVPLGFYSKKSNRIAATRWLLNKGKTAEDLSENDFCSNGLAGLADHYSTKKLHFPYEALIEAGVAYSEKEALEYAAKGEFNDQKIYPWQRKMANMDYYAKEENRVAALKWASWKTQKPLSMLTKEDAREGCVYYLFQQPYLGWTRAFITSQD